jgi:hypothetical protein
LADPDTKYATIKTTKVLIVQLGKLIFPQTEVLKRLEAKKVPYAKKIVRHLSMSVICKETVPLIFETLKATKDKHKFALIIKLLEVFHSFYRANAS